jgi:ATP synthase protein I
MPLSKEERKRLAGDLRLYGSLGIEMAASVLIGTFIGYWIDKWLGTLPWILIIGFVFGAAAGFRNLYRFISREDLNRGKEK